jgi:hypothetical protein
LRARVKAILRWLAARSGALHLCAIAPLR